MAIQLRHLVLTLAIALLAGSVCFPPRAEETTVLTGDEANTQALAHVRERLQLTDDQAEKIGPLLFKQIDVMKDLFDGYSGQGAESLPALMQEFQETRESFRVTIDPILTDQQKIGAMEMRKEVDAAIKNTICEHKISTLKERLGLSDLQVAALRPIINDNFDQKRALISFHVSQTGGPRTRRALGPEIRKADQDLVQSLQGVLTPTQMKTYNAFIAGQRQTLREAAAVPR